MHRLSSGARVLLLAVTATLAACFPIKFAARMPLPEPLIEKMPFAVALHIPPEFANFTQKEKRWSVKWEVSLGQAQAEGFSRLLNSMFERVILVDSIEAATRGEPVRAILEPAIDEYAFVTPRDAGSSFFAVSIKYRMGIYTPDGRLADSWAFTGYGSAPTAGMSDEDSLHRATTLALRDAAAKLAVEFRDQEIVRELLPGADAHGASANAEEEGAPAGSAPAPTEGAPAQDNGTATKPGAAAEGASSDAPPADAAGSAQPEVTPPPTETGPAPTDPTPAPSPAEPPAANAPSELTTSAS